MLEIIIMEIRLIKGLLDVIDCWARTFIHERPAKE
jgi:hypothetical protein